MLPFIGITKARPVVLDDSVWDIDDTLTEVYGPITNRGMSFDEEMEMRSTTNGFSIDPDTINQNYDGLPKDVMVDMDRCTDPVNRLELGVSYAGMHTGADCNFEQKYGRYFGPAPSVADPNSNPAE